MTQRMNYYAAAPEGLKALLNVEAYLKTGGVEPPLLHLVKTRVSQLNGCAFCLHMHTTEARKDGESEARLYLLNAWQESALFSPRERAALAWAEALTSVTEGHVPDTVYDQARAQFSEKELADLSIAVAMINGWNRIAIAFRAQHPNDRRS
ncbi:MAG: carboxymuconolactone decarboxylase family protein [Alphaproteobacteria bacterium]|nr:carboxymuconolactone decarboxylase family protein [Alphaproteobacteria bacterium]